MKIRKEENNSHTKIQLKIIFYLKSKAWKRKNEINTQNEMQKLFEFFVQIKNSIMIVPVLLQTIANQWIIINNDEWNIKASYYIK